MNEQPVLFDYWRSSACYRVRIVLNLKGVAYRAEPVDLLAGKHQEPPHLERNPQGFVPVLDIDGLRLSQSLAIIEYLDETRPAPPLIPRAPGDRAQVRALAYVVAMEIHPLCIPVVVRRVADLGGKEAGKDWMRAHVERGLGAFERLLDHPATGRFCHGDQPTLADCCLVPQLYNARRWGLDTASWPALARIDAACAELPAFAAAHPDQIAAPV